MKTIKTLLRPKWVFFALWLALGIALYNFPGYSFSGLCTMASAALIPFFHLLNRISNPGVRKWLLLLSRTGLCVVILAVAITFGIINHAAAGTPDPQSDYLIVLGAGVNGTTPSLSLRNRIDAARDYLNAHPDVIAVVSGGQGPDEAISEAQCMFNELTRAGIAPERIWMEDKSTSTLENLRFSMDVIEARTGVRPTSAAIISSEYHLFRAGMFASWVGLDAELVPAKTTWFTLRLSYTLREVFAVWYYSIFGG